MKPGSSVLHSPKKPCGTRCLPRFAGRVVSADSTKGCCLPDRTAAVRRAPAPGLRSFRIRSPAGGNVRSPHRVRVPGHEESSWRFGETTFLESVLVGHTKASDALGGALHPSVLHKAQCYRGLTVSMAHSVGVNVCLVTHTFRLIRIVEMLGVEVF